MARIIEHLDNGVVVWQVTDDPRLISNIYCEWPYTSADSRRFLYARQMDGAGADRGTDWEYVLCEFGTWTEEVVGRGQLSVSVSYRSDFYYLRRSAGAAAEMMRLDLNTGTAAAVFAYPDGIARAGHPTASPDGRYLAYGVVLSYAPQRFGVELADTVSGERHLICEDPDLCNTHAQFEPAAGRYILIQDNRGCRFAADGKRLALVGEEGATVFLLEAATGSIVRLPVGKPFTTPLTGHQTWVGRTQDIIMTVAASGRFTEERGNILLTREGECGFRQIAAGWRMNHIGATPCGRYFHADGSKHQDIIVGSPHTGRAVRVCHSRSAYAPEWGQQGHPHAYLTPDYRWVVFNSDRSGRPQLYVAAVPDGLLAGLD